jgi:hypothetical protein
MLSRKITSLDELKQLVVSNRVEVSLSEGPSSHLLRVEATLSKKYAATEILDTYYANCDAPGHPRASAFGMVLRRPTGQRLNNNTDSVLPITVSSQSTSQSKDVINVKSQSYAKADSDKIVSCGKSCSKCKSTSHLIKDCPQRDGTRPQIPKSWNGQKPGQSTLARVNACSTNATLAELNFVGPLKADLGH